MQAAGLPLPLGQPFALCDDLDSVKSGSMQKIMFLETRPSGPVFYTPSLEVSTRSVGIWARQGETNFSNGARPLRWSGVLVLGLGIRRVRLKRQAP